MEVPNVVRKDFMLIGMDDGFLSLMDDSGDTRDDLKCPEDSVGDEIRKAIADEIDILVGGGKHQIHSSLSFIRVTIVIIIIDINLTISLLPVYCVDRLWRGVRDCYQS